MSLLHNPVYDTCQPTLKGIWEVYAIQYCVVHLLWHLCVPPTQSLSLPVHSYAAYTRSKCLVCLDVCMALFGVRGGMYVCAIDCL